MGNNRIETTKPGTRWADMQWAELNRFRRISKDRALTEIELATVASIRKALGDIGSPSEYAERAETFDKVSDYAWAGGVVHVYPAQDSFDSEPGRFPFAERRDVVPSTFGGGFSLGGYR